MVCSHEVDDVLDGKLNCVGVVFFDQEGLEVSCSEFVEVNV